MNKDRLATAIVTAIQGLSPSWGLLTPGEQAIALTYWKAIANEIINEIKDHADIELMASDISILPGTFEDSLNAPITGLGENDAVILTEKIK